MKSKKSASRVKDPKLQKCRICLHEFLKDQLDKHMHSRVHHEVIERLLGGQHLHRCWACNLSLRGLELYKSHIATSEHMTKLYQLEASRQRGNRIKDDYNDKDLIALCVKKKAELKQQKRMEKMKRRVVKTSLAKERSRKCQKKEKNREVLNKKSLGKGMSYETNSLLGKQMTMTGSQIHNQQPQSVAPQLWVGLHDGGDHIMQKQDRRFAMIQNSSVEPGCKIGVQPYVESRLNWTEGWNSCYWQQTSIFSSKVDEDLKSDHVFPSGSILFDESELGEGTPQAYNQQTNTEISLQKGIQKRLCNMESSNSVLVKKRCLNNDPSARANLNMPAGSSFGERVQGETVVQPTIFAKPSALKEKRSPHIKTLSTLNHLTMSSADIQKENESNRQSEEKPSGNKHILPTVLKQSVSKAASCKPNLNVARGTRTTQKPGTKDGESRVLKTSLQKLISSNSSQRKLDWLVMYQEAQRKLQKEKGMPRFGIELVSPLPHEPQELVQEDVSDAILDEGFHWESITLDAEIPSSSVDHLRGSQWLEGNMHFEDPNTETEDGGKSRTGHASWPGQTVAKKKDNIKSEDCEKGRVNNVTSELEGTSKPQMEGGPKTGTTLCGAFVTQHVTAPGVGSLNVTSKKPDDCDTMELQRVDDRNSEFSIVKQIKKEKQDVPDVVFQDVNPEKGQVGELLAMSLREEELSKSQNEVDGQLFQARIALQAAFMEVQRLQGFRQQLTSEMAFLRTKRLDILQGLQNSGLDPPKHTSDILRVPNASTQQAALLPNHSSIPAEVQNKAAAPSQEQGSTCGTQQSTQCTNQNLD